MSNGFSLAATVDESSSNNDDTSESSDSETATHISESDRFEANEVGDLYIAGGDWRSPVGKITVEIADFERPSVAWEDDLSDFERKVEGNNYNDQQKLYLLAALFKGTVGAMQSELNEGYGNGLDNDFDPPKPYDNDRKDHYGDLGRGLEAIEWAGLTEAERTKFEEEGYDPSDFGFDREFDGPKIPVINGERLPIIVSEGDELQRACELIDMIDFDNLTYCVEDGDLQNEPTEVLTVPEGDTDETSVTVEVEDDNEVSDDLDLAANPERINDVNVNDIKVGNIDSLRTIQTMLRVESDSDNTRSTAMKKLKGRRKTLKSDDDPEDDEDTDLEAETDEEVSDSEMNLISALLDNDEADSFEEAKATVLGL
jgi:hypothetical protein